MAPRLLRLGAAGIWLVLNLTACATTSSPMPPALPSGSVDHLLDEFVAASADFDVERMSSLFLAPDATPAGENRRLHLRAIHEDWPAAREASVDMQVAFRSVSFDDAIGVVSAQMVASAGTESGARFVELVVTPSPAGLKIVAMRFP